jgi:hypothetical protein
MGRTRPGASAAYGLVGSLTSRAGNVPFAHAMNALTASPPAGYPAHLISLGRRCDPRAVNGLVECVLMPEHVPLYSIVLRHASGGG